VAINQVTRRFLVLLCTGGLITVLGISLVGWAAGPAALPRPMIMLCGVIASLMGTGTVITSLIYAIVAGRPRYSLRALLVGMLGCGLLLASWSPWIKPALRNAGVEVSNGAVNITIESSSGSAFSSTRVSIPLFDPAAIALLLLPTPAIFGIWWAWRKLARRANKPLLQTDCPTTPRSDSPDSSAKLPSP
jgi:hypothetical protein